MKKAKKKILEKNNEPVLIIDTQCIQEFAEDDLGRRLTKDEMTKAREALFDYEDAFFQIEGAIQSAIEIAVKSK